MKKKKKKRKILGITGGISMGGCGQDHYLTVAREVGKMRQCCWVSRINFWPLREGGSVC